MNLNLAIMIILGLTLIVLYGLFIEPCQTRLKIIKVRNKTLALTFKDMKIALISDLHIGANWSASVKRSLKIIEEIKPDLILLTGDFLEWKRTQKSYDNAIKYLSHLNAPIGIYAVRGDADCFVSRNSCELCHKDGSIFPTENHQVTFLRNSQVFLEYRGNKFAIVGISMDSKHVPDFNIPNNMVNDIPYIILSHTSLVYYDIDAKNNVLVLSGDTHGGQVYLPRFLWKIIKMKPDPAHMYGLYLDKNKALYVTSGIGTSPSLPVRLGVPPEVVLFKFEE